MRHILVPNVHMINYNILYGALGRKHRLSEAIAHLSRVLGVSWTPPAAPQPDWLCLWTEHSSAIYTVAMWVFHRIWNTQRMLEVERWGSHSQSSRKMVSTTHFTSFGPHSLQDSCQARGSVNSKHTLSVPPHTQKTPRWDVLAAAILGLEAQLPMTSKPQLRSALGQKGWTQLPVFDPPLQVMQGQERWPKPCGPAWSETTRQDTTALSQAFFLFLFVI